MQGGRAGNGSGSELRTVEVCSSIPSGTPSDFEGPTSVEWLYTSDMTVPRTCLAAASLQDSLYAVGGQAGRQIWDTVESYDAQQDAWVQLPGHMHSERKYTSAGVLHGELVCAACSLGAAAICSRSNASCKQIYNCDCLDRQSWWPISLRF